MTAQLDVEALVGLLERSTPRPWYFVQHQAGGEWFGNILGSYGTNENGVESIRTITCQTRYGEASEIEGNAALIVAAVNALPALLAHIAGEDARVAAAVAGAAEANNKAWATTLDPAPTPYDGPSQVTITPGIHDALYRALLASQTIVEPAIRETPSAE